jgi:hypothetical protein
VSPEAHDERGTWGWPAPGVQDDPHKAHQPGGRMFGKGTRQGHREGSSDMESQLLAFDSQAEKPMRTRRSRALDAPRS